MWINKNILHQVGDQTRVLPKCTVNRPSRWKNTLEPDRTQMAIWLMRFAFCVNKATKHLFRICYICGFSTATMVNLTRLNVAFIRTSLKYNQKDALFSQSVYFYKLLYMFQAVSPPIIRNTKLYIQRQVLSNQFCCLLLSWVRWICTVLCSWWWAEEPPETCRAIYRNK